MNVSDMVLDFTDHGFADVTSVRAVAMLNDAYWDVCAREPWPFLVKTVRLTFSGTSYEPVTPITDLRAVVATKVENNGSPLVYLRTDSFEEAYGDFTIVQGTDPAAFSVDGTKAMHFYPAPSAATVVRVTYLYRPVALAANTTEANIVIPMEFHRSVLVNGALFKMYSMEDDTATAPVFETYYERGISNMLEQCFKDDYSRPEIIHPIDADDLGMDVTFGMGWLGRS